MKLYYSHVKKGNFGDDLNRWLWERLLPVQFDDNDEQIFVGIGTLLNRKLNLRTPRDSLKLVFGSGVGYGEPPIVDETWRFYFVRGPLSAEILGIDRKLAITDGAILVRRVLFNSMGSRHRCSYMPHHKSTSNADWKGICEAAHVNYVDPAWPVERVLNEIQRSDVVVAEAMHGAIIADALRVPWIPVRGYEHILDFKWKDWCQSMDLRYRPMDLPEVWDPGHDSSKRERARQLVKRLLLSAGFRRQGWENLPHRKTDARVFEEAVLVLNRIAQSVEPILSTDSQVELATARCEERLELFQKDFLTPL